MPELSAQNAQPRSNPNTWIKKQKTDSWFDASVLFARPELLKYSSALGRSSRIDASNFEEVSPFA